MNIICIQKRPLGEDLGIDGRRILKWFLKKCDGSIDVVQDRDKWQNVVSVVMKLQVL